MFKFRILSIGLVLSVVLLSAGNTDAGNMFNVALTNHVVNNLEDDNAEILFDRDQSGTVTANDLLLSIITTPFIDPEGSAPPPTTAIGTGTAYNELTGLALINVATVDALGDGQINPGNGILHDDFTFNAPTLAEWTWATTQFGGPAVTPTMLGTVAMVWDDAAQDFNRDAGIQAGISSVTGGTLAWEWGMSGVIDAQGRVNPAAGEGWRAFAPVQFIFSGQASFEFALDNLLTGPGGAVLIPTTQFGGVAPFGGPLALVQGSGDFESASSTSGFAIFSDTDIYVQPIPEPGALTLVLCGLTSLLCWRRKR